LIFGALVIQFVCSGGDLANISRAYAHQLAEKARSVGERCGEADEMGTSTSPMTPASQEVRDLSPVSALVRVDFVDEHEAGLLFGSYTNSEEAPVPHSR
jgi:hypothetical protein